MIATTSINDLLEDGEYLKEEGISQIVSEAVHCMCREKLDSNKNILKGYTK